MTRIKRLTGSANYATNGVVESRSLSSTTSMPCNVKCSSKRTDMTFVGKLKTCREASKIIDFRASQVADYILVSENRNTGAVRMLTKNTLCPTNGNCSVTLQTKVGPLKSTLLNRNRL